MNLIRTLLSRELVALGLRSLRAHKLRSFLTALGMIFGVGAVICMLSIGEGQAAEQLENIKQLGSQNIVLRSAEPPKSQSVSENEDSVLKYGLTRADVERIRRLPHVADIVLMREVSSSMTRVAKKFDEGKVLGITENFFDAVSVRIARGRSLTPMDGQTGAKVCVIGAIVARSLFEHEDPLGQTITVLNFATGPVPYRVVGVLADVATAGKPAEGVARRDLNRDAYIPLATADLRYGDLNIKWSRTSREVREVQLSDVYIRIDDQEHVMEVSRLVERALEHLRKERDYAVTVPLALIEHAKQIERQKQIILGSIAGISLLVGGIGIMNIMLASVTERTREIGIRRALGAKRAHITAQFLIETLMLSISGGIIGIIVGIALAFAITKWYADWKTIISGWSVAVAFFVSAAVGISFGLYPARAAAHLDPIEALNAKR
jgi:putative ABC transport system permease protein